MAARIQCAQHQQTTSQCIAVQPKLGAAPAHDPLEREADRVAGQVTGMPAHSTVVRANPRIKPFSLSSASEALTASVSSGVDKALAGSGTALSPAVRQDMERRFGFDFSRVRIYADSEAGQSAGDMGAHAYTTGHKVAFAPGRFSPTTKHGLRLLSHELTHVVQQAGGSGATGVRQQPLRVVQRQHDTDIGGFAPVTNLNPKGSLTDAQWADPNTNDVQRFADIVAIAQAEWIYKLSGSAANKIKRITNKNEAEPGLNYFEKLNADGETGYIDGGGQYHKGTDLPVHSPADPLPRIAIILGGSAFKPGKAVALETLRHELRHATHEQLTIDWILKWRKAAAGKSFADWVRAQHKAKKISDVDLDLVLTGTLRSGPAGTYTDKSATEVLAYVEGIITGLPFLPPQPDLNLFKDGRYPAPVDELYKLLIYFDAAIKPVQTLALQRLHDFCCQRLDSAHRAHFMAWILFLMNPASLNASSKAEKEIQDLVVKDFHGHESFLKQLLASVQKPC